MLERVPAAAESTAQFFLRSVEKPVRSSRILDPRFWRNGADDFEPSAWWPSYLQRIRAIPQIRQPVHDENTATSCPPQPRRANHRLLRQKREPVRHAPVTVQAQQSGTTLRSYSVSIRCSQSTGSGLAEELIETDHHEQDVAREKLHGFSKKQDKSQRKNVNETAISKKLATHQSVRPQSSTSKMRPGRRAKAISYNLNAFDLTADAPADWLGDDVVEQQKVPPYLPKYARRKPVVDSVPKRQDQDRNSARKASSKISYRSFDLDFLHKSPLTHSEAAFDLDLVIEQERVSHSNYLDSVAGSGDTASELPTHIEASGDSIPYSEADLYTGWRNSNPLAALVPEDVSPDKNRQDIAPVDFDVATSKIPMVDSDEVPQEREIPFRSIDPNVNTVAQDSSEMANSFEARSPAMMPFDLSLQVQEVPPLSNMSEATSLQSQPRSSRRERFETLLRVRKPAATTTELLDEAWSLFLSFDNQEDLAPYMYRLLNQSPDSKQFPRALAAFNTIPRPRRTQAMYKAAIDIELKRHQHGSAMNLAFEANIKGFNVLPDLFAYLVKNLLWNSVAEVLHRNKYARQDFAQFAPVPDFSATASRRMLSIPELMHSCSDIPDLHAKVLSLAERVQSSDSAFTEHMGLLTILLQRLAISVVRNQNVMISVTPQALVSILNLEDFLGNLGLHNKALDTILQLPSRGEKMDIALMVYRNYRFKHPDKTPNPRIIKELISLCGDADQPSVHLFDYLLDQFKGKPDLIAYQRVMTYCAREGDAAAVEKYLECFIRDHGNPPRAAFVHPLIYAYAVVGDVSNAREKLTLLLTKYKLEPNTVSWNILMLAHVRSDDDVSAFDIREEMRSKNVDLNHYTYGQLLAVCAAHGDIEAALDVLVDARDDDIEITVPMVHTVVATYLRNDNYQAALRFAMTAIDSADKQALTHMWNSFIRYFAFKGNLQDLMKMRDLMARYKITADGMTYAPIMTLLTSMRQTSEAMKLLQRMHQEEKLPVTRVHYSIILYGFVAEGNRDMAALVFNEMKQRFPDISASAQAAMQYLQAHREVSARSPESELDGVRGVEMLAELLKDVSSVRGSLFSPLSLKTKKNDVAISMYFETIVRALIRSGFHDSAAQLMQHINVTVLASPKSESTSLRLSKGMTLAQLDIAMERQDWAEFQRIFHNAFQVATQRNGPIPVHRRGYSVEDEKPTRSATAPSHARYSLSSYFNRYMEAMARQFRQSTMINFFRKNLSRSGFVFTGRNWNKYIQVLCRSRQSKHQLKAFRIFERTMLRRTQSWKLLVRGMLRKRTTNYLWQPYGQRNRPILQKQNTYRFVKRSEELQFHPERRVPTYLTAVHLGAVLIQAHFRVRRGLPLQFDLIRRFTPKTKKFIQYMPRLKDGIQASILRQVDLQGEKKSRPRSEKSMRDKTDLVGLLGDASPLNQIPNEFLNDIEEIVGRGNLVRSLLKDNQAVDGRVDQVRTDIELGEMLTGQIERGPIVLAGKGRLESPNEMSRRITGEERQKQRVVERLRDDLRARQLAGDIHQSPLHVQAPLDLSVQQDLNAIRQQSSVGEGLQIPVPAHTAALAIHSSNFETGSDKLLGEVPLQQQLNELAKRRERKEESANSRQKQQPFPGLAIPFMQLRRLRRRLGLRERQRTWQALEEIKDRLSPRAYQSRVAAAQRLEAFERARRRRQAVLAYERDLRAGKRLDPFPQTEEGVRRRKLNHGGIRIRFTTDYGRKSKNYLVRRGVLHDRRQRQVQTVPSKGKNYVTRYERIAQWIEARYGPRANVSNGMLGGEGGVEKPAEIGDRVKGEEIAASEELEEKAYRPF